MDEYLFNWINDNKNLFRYLKDLKNLKQSAERILLSGDVSVLLCKEIGKLFPKADLIGIESRENIIEKAIEESSRLTIIPKDFTEVDSAPESFDIIISALQLEKLSSRESTKYLLKLNDALKYDGIILISFPDSAWPVVGEPMEKRAYYNEKETMKFKLYTTEDVIFALQSIGFKIKAIEQDKNPDLINVVTLILTK